MQPVSHSISVGLSSRVLGVIRAAIAGIVKSRRKKRTRLVLHELPDWMLRDIGLHRSEVDFILADYYAALETAPKRHRKQ
jgi:uncharacterized protein YjiS (DUF1127 family)